MLRSLLPSLALVLSLYPCPVSARQDRDPLRITPEITGQVRLEQRKTPVKSAPVRLESSAGSLTSQMMTDSVGRFTFSGLQRGQYFVSVHVPGYRPEKHPVEITSIIRRVQLLIELEPEESPSLAPSELLDARLPVEAIKEFEKGRAALRDGKVEKAISHLEKAVRLHADFFDAQLLLGTAYLDAQQWEKAETALRRALELRPHSSVALVELGEVYRRQKRFTEAESSLLVALKLDDRSWQGHFTLARVYWEMGDATKASPAAERALQLNPNYPEAHLLMANIFMRLNLFAQALLRYEEYLRLAPKGAFAVQTREITRRLKQQPTAASK